jgi:septal ring factor EnvC (AmiA/AmiB activator)
MRHKPGELQNEIQNSFSHTPQEPTQKQNEIRYLKEALRESLDTNAELRASIILLEAQIHKLERLKKDEIREKSTRWRKHYPVRLKVVRS